ncbi:MAG: TspO/MBR family protein [Alphaproteobacteria bacterium]
MRAKFKSSDLFMLILWIAVFEAVAAAIGYATRPEVDGWYAALERPWFTPPNSIFPVMWTLLYAMIAAAGFYIWRARQADAGGRQRLGLFAVYMALNWSWSFVFFSAGQLLIGFIWILVMNLVSVILIVKAWHPLRRAALLLIPPLLWTSFAALLSGAFWWLNRGA